MGATNPSEMKNTFKTLHRRTVIQGKLEEKAEKLLKELQR